MPTCCWPKACNTGVTVYSGVTPVPDSGIANVITLSVAVLLPLDVGVKLTVTVQLVLGASEAGQLFVKAN